MAWCVPRADDSVLTLYFILAKYDCVKHRGKSFMGIGREAVNEGNSFKSKGWKRTGEAHCMCIYTHTR